MFAGYKGNFGDISIKKLDEEGCPSENWITQILELRRVRILEDFGATG